MKLLILFPNVNGSSTRIPGVVGSSPIRGVLFSTSYYLDCIENNGSQSKMGVITRQTVDILGGSLHKQVYLYTDIAMIIWYQTILTQLIISTPKVTRYFLCHLEWLCVNKTDNISDTE